VSHPALSILIPAAGASKRLGQLKQLVQYKTGSLIQNAVTAAHSIAPREIIVITGSNAKAVKDAVQQTPVRWIHNPHWSTGMGRSIALGAAAISPESIGLMIFLCDQWRIQTQDLSELAGIWQSDPKRIVCAEADGLLMPPAIFPSGCFRQLRELEGNQGAQILFQAHSELLRPVPLKNAVFDLDTVAQLAQLKNFDV
jgi:molybdenum cofactor cytidylyltransferase